MMIPSPDSPAVLIHSAGGDTLDAIIIGSLIRARGLDVAVARTELDSCSVSLSGCKTGEWTGALGRPSLQPAQCFSACTLVLAGGVRRFVGPGAQIGVHSISLPKTRVEKLRRTYRGNKSLEDLVWLQIIPSEMPRIRRYFEKMGIAAEIAGMMDSTASTDLRILSESELARVKLVTDQQAGQSLIEQLAK